MCWNLYFEIIDQKLTLVSQPIKTLLTALAVAASAESLLKIKNDHFSAISRLPKVTNVIFSLYR